MDFAYTDVLKIAKKRIELEVGIDCTYLYDKIKPICCKIHDENIQQIAI